MNDLNLMSIINELYADRSIDHLLSGREGEIVYEIPFSVNNKNYRVYIIRNVPKSVVIVYFVNLDVYNTLQRTDYRTDDEFRKAIEKAKMGITNTAKGDEFKIFNKVYNIMLQYIEKYKPKYIGFEAFEMNRQSLYKKISDRLNKELIEIKYKEFDKNPITNEKLKPNQFFFERIDDENKEIK